MSVKPGYIKLDSVVYGTLKNGKRVRIYSVPDINPDMLCVHSLVKTKTETPRIQGFKDAEDLVRKLRDAVG